MRRAAHDQQVGLVEEFPGRRDHRYEGYLMGRPEGVRDVGADDMRVAVHRFVDHKCLMVSVSAGAAEQA
jgi:hypothetical protein